MLNQNISLYSIKRFSEPKPEFSASMNMKIFLCFGEFTLRDIHEVYIRKYHFYAFKQYLDRVVGMYEKYAL